ncbi:hypothetical protein Taro_011370 [Colocasia esculenta]|uniref:Uncharacterized protein n=1 Tax=Colocasia esculenta TaxID=4460 RepID=A0A843UAN3_COLES|nr:hypothetical protein [Colocasia esculenta]
MVPLSQYIDCIFSVSRISPCILCNIFFLASKCSALALKLPMLNGRAGLAIYWPAEPLRTTLDEHPCNWGELLEDKCFPPVQGGGTCSKSSGRKPYPLLKFDPE